MPSEMTRVVIVEDDRDLRETLESYLSMSGFQVEGVGTCRELYRALDAACFDVALLDVGLPDQSGIILAEYLRKNTGMGIIILTALDSDGDKLAGYAAGADLYLTKPVDSRLLVLAITNLDARLKSRGGVQQPEQSEQSWILDVSAWLLQSPNGIATTLTTQELKFLMIFAQSPAEPVDREVIMQQLYNRSDYYTGKALGVMIHRLRAKVKANVKLPMPLKSFHFVGYGFTSPLIVR